MADRVFPLSTDRQHAERAELHKKRFPRAPYSLPPAYYRERSERHASRGRLCCCCCCYICAIIATLLLILLVLAAFLYLVLQPKAPTFSITRAYITEFNLTREPKEEPLYLQANVNFTIVAGNPNKKIGIHYEKIKVELVYEGVEIGKGSMPSFYVGKRESEEMGLQVNGEHTLLEQRVGLDLQRAVQEESNMWVQVKTVAYVSVQVWGFKSRHAKLLILCNVQMNSPLPHTNAHLLSKACKLKGLTV